MRRVALIGMHKKKWVRCMAADNPLRSHYRFDSKYLTASELGVPDVVAHKNVREGLSAFGGSAFEGAYC